MVVLQAAALPPDASTHTLPTSLDHPPPPQQVMAGQGTVSIEILEQMAEADAAAAGEGGGARELVVFIPVGGGGLIGGMAAVSGWWFFPRRRLWTVISALRPNIISPKAARHLIYNPQVLKTALGSAVTVVGCQPSASDVMRLSVAAGRIVEAPCGDTLSDATAGGIEEGAVTLAPCIDGVDEW